MFAARARNQDFVVETLGARVRWPEFADAAALGPEALGLDARSTPALAASLGLDAATLGGDRIVFAARRGNCIGCGLTLLVEPREGGRPLGLVHVVMERGRARTAAFGRGSEAWSADAVLALRVALRPVPAPRAAPRRRAPARVLAPA